MKLELGMLLSAAAAARDRLLMEKILELDVVIGERVRRFVEEEEELFKLSDSKDSKLTK